MRYRTLLGWLTALVVAGSGSASGQLPRIGLVHGLASDSSTWDVTKAQLLSALRPTYIDTVFTPTLGWSDVYSDQRARMFDNYGSRLDANTILFGHSNGGIVSRLVGQRRALLGVVTIGSPQHGAPLVDN